MTTKTETYYERLARAQNSPANDVIDIMTITAFMNTEAERMRHLEHYEAKAAAYEMKEDAS